MPQTGRSEDEDHSALRLEDDLRPVDHCAAMQATTLQTMFGNVESLSTNRAPPQPSLSTGIHEVADGPSTMAEP
ncbi:hypothetical protein [Aureimonas leprariae]|uniref:Uncharacterized protein n=1 Tax=Plantimonas leprariae TaxID=2615207 RepID=A0A7V7PKJ5_9HYPH|nr:hypothetical protein [Aureimonas leprariae]KAB0676188.1 hypothetical protein F6X38_21830 [Aureimonas leprariae]